jgi:lipopolysaccharide transport system ATP-binding protein
MARISLENVTLAYPAVRAGSSMRVEILKQMTGGLVESKSDLTQVKAIRSLSVEIRDGDRVGFVGHNGAGKSTLLKVMAGIYKPDSGRVTVEGKIGSLLDHGLGIDPEETGWENLRFYFNLFSEDHSQTDALALEVAEFTELGEFLNLPVRTYSAGMHMRLSFGLATAMKPTILLMDEVIGAGDAGFYVKAEDRLNKMAESAKIIVLATHSADLITSWCNKVVWMEKGTIKQIGTPDEILQPYYESMGAGEVP